MVSICDAFKEHSKEGFDKIRLFRFEDWKFGTENGIAMDMLMTIFLSLHDVETREENLKIVDFDKLHKIKAFTDKQKQNLEDFFIA